MQLKLHKFNTYGKVEIHTDRWKHSINCHQSCDHGWFQPYQIFWVRTTACIIWYYQMFWQVKHSVLLTMIQFQSVKILYASPHPIFWKRKLLILKILNTNSVEISGKRNMIQIHNTTKNLITSVTGFNLQTNSTLSGGLISASGISPI